MKLKKLLFTLFVCLCSFQTFSAVNYRAENLLKSSLVGENTHYENFRVIMVENILSQFLIIDEDNRKLALHLLRRVEFGQRFIDYIGCNNPKYKASVEVMSKCLGHANVNRPEDFSMFYRHEIDAAIDILVVNGFLKKV